MPGPSQEEFDSALQTIHAVDLALIDGAEGCFDAAIVEMGALVTTLDGVLSQYTPPPSGQPPMTWSTINGWKQQASSIKMSIESLKAQLGALQGQYNPQPLPPSPLLP